MYPSRINRRTTALSIVKEAPCVTLSHDVSRRASEPQTDLSDTPELRHKSNVAVTQMKLSLAEGVETPPKGGVGGSGGA